jgi:hypothetical protein
LKIRVSVVRFRPRPPNAQALDSKRTQGLFCVWSVR